MHAEGILDRLDLIGEVLSEIGVGASLVDRSMKVVWCNRAMAQRAADLSCAADQHCFAYHWKLQSRCADCLPAIVFQTGEAREGVRERQRPGEPRHVYRVTAVPVRDSEGAVTRVLETFVDVSRLGTGHAAPEPLQHALAGAGHGTVVVDPRDRIVSWSGGMTAILGHGVDEVLGRDAGVLLEPGARASAPWRREGRHETDLVASDGRHVPVAVTASPIRDDAGEVCGYQALVEDRSELARLRREVELSQTALAEIVRCSGDAILSTDRVGRIASWNEGAESQLGWSAAEAGELALADLVGAPASAELLDDAAAGATVRGRRRAARHRSGSTVVLDLTASPLRGAEGEPAGLSIVARDVSRQERLEQQIVRSEKLAAVGSLVAGIAHEIGTPLNVISASTEYVLLDLPADHPHRIELAAIIAETDRIQRLIGDLLGFARGQARSEGSSDAAAAVERVVRLLGGQIRKRRATVEIASARVPDVAAGEDALHQVLLNVLMNALAAIPEGGSVRVEVLPGTLAVDPAAGAPLPAVCFRVADDGPGIPTELRRRVFDPFFTTRPDGTGLGLAVTSRIVSDLGGNILVGDGPLGGALVEIALPVAAGPPAGNAGTAGTDGTVAR